MKVSDEDKGNNELTKYRGTVLKEEITNLVNKIVKISTTPLELK